MYVGHLKISQEFFDLGLWNMIQMMGMTSNNV